MNSNQLVLTLYLVYLLECRGGSIYTGITNDLDRRIACHESGKGSKYVRSHLPVKLLGETPCMYTRSEALKIENKIKQVSHDKKLETLRLYAVK